MKVAQACSRRQKGTAMMNVVVVAPVVWSPEQPVPEGHEGGGVKGTDEDEEQKVETHHDGEVVSEEP